MQTVGSTARRTFAAAAIFAVLIIGGIIAISPERSAPVAASTVVAVREALVSGLPEAAPGQELSLVRTTIPPGVTLPLHIHPGMQLAWIESGELHYYVVEGGEVPITRAGMEGSPEPAEMLGPGQQTILYPGDTVVEVESVVHYAENLGDVPVVIWSATLLTEGAPIAEVVEIAATPTP
jgi:quercetin dioxygenase-like cupin family protein